MRHKHKGNRLSRKTSHRLSLLQNLSSDLILYESVETTLAKAKELKRYAEKMITKAKVDSVHNRRLVISKIGPSDAYKKLFEDIGNRFKDRDGGYTRIIRIPSSNTKSKFKSYYRKGDGAELARVELVRESNQIDNSTDSEESNKVTDPSNGTD
jgi:large subunit ribosomal protein L17